MASKSADPKSHPYETRDQRDAAIRLDFSRGADLEGLMRAYELSRPEVLSIVYDPAACADGIRANATTFDTEAKQAPSVLEALSAAERASLLSMSLHNMLIQRDQADCARIAWVVYLDVSRIADDLGERYGLEVADA